MNDIIQDGGEPMMILIRSKTNTIKIKTKALKSEDNYEECKENLNEIHKRESPVHQFQANDVIKTEPNDTEFAEEWLADKKDVIKLEKPFEKYWFHVVDGRFECSFCQKKYRALGTLEKHMVLHYTKTISHCENCNLEFKALELIEEHIHQHMLAQPQAGALCPTLLGTSDGLSSCLYAVSDLAVACGLCSTAFTSQEKLKAHIWERHVKNTFMCKLCGKKSDQESELKIHVMSHKEGKSPWRRREQCVFCNRTYANKGSLYEHQQNQHFDIMAHKCKYCEKHFSTKSNLRRHIKYTCLPQRASARQSQDMDDSDTIAEAGHSILSCTSPDSIIVEPDIPLYNFYEFADHNQASWQTYSVPTVVSNNWLG